MENRVSDKSEYLEQTHTSSNVCKRSKASNSVDRNTTLVDRKNGAKEALRDAGAEHRLLRSPAALSECSTVDGRCVGSVRPRGVNDYFPTDFPGIVKHGPRAGQIYRPNLQYRVGPHNTSNQQHED